MNSKIRPIKDILWFLALFALMAGIFRMWFGLGATTNMVDGIPWGLWKILNMVAGAALATSGFMIGMLYYVFRIKLFKPLVMPSIVVAFLGYGSSLFSLVFDIGLPWMFWIPFFAWSPHSFLYEVFWCVSLYWAVTAFEFTPSIFERFKGKKIARILHGMGFGAAVLGISLSSLHHSSLGSLFLVTPQRLHTLWYSPTLPLHFIISAMGAGLMFLLLIKILYAHFYDKESVFGSAPKDGSQAIPGKDMPMLRLLAIIAVSILGFYLILKIVDLSLYGKWQDLLVGTWESWLFSFELLLAAVIPVVLVIIPKIRRSPTGLGIASLSAVAGLVINRLDVGIIGYFRDAGVVYFPSLLEWLLCFGIIAATFLVFLLIIENFSIFSESWKDRRDSKGVFKASFDSLSYVWDKALGNSVQRVTLIAAIAIPFGWIMQYPPYHQKVDDKTVVQPAIGVDALRDTLRIDGNREGVFVDFQHTNHQKHLGEELSCKKCHHISMPGDKSTSCYRCHRDMFQETLIFDHKFHEEAVAKSEGFGGFHPENFTCIVCHTSDLAKTAGNSKPCLECHIQDMGLEGVADSSLDISRADSYCSAMHETCIKCHEEEAIARDKENFSDCATCHQSLRQRENLMEAMTTIETSQLTK
ncbi:MAG: NrfD/PsrC family molybdoenzyme membrane anchor subunit [Candidatus Hatepunaea meridiana]|nr:NrfD/PsrC family molybdoenzyme membrane anchor subunit [Candidatus Hatepunaea meridiana]